MAEEKPDKQDIQPNLSDLINLHQAAEQSGLSHSHLRLLARKGTIWATRLGQDWFTTSEAVREYLAQDRRRGPKPSKHENSPSPND